MAKPIDSAFLQEIGQACVDQMLHPHAQGQSDDIWVRLERALQTTYNVTVTFQMNARTIEEVQRVANTVASGRLVENKMVHIEPVPE